MTEGTGYMFLTIDKPFYRPGETVKGIVFFELFHQSVQDELFLKFDGVQILPSYLKKKVMGFETQMSSSEAEIPVNKNLKIISMGESKISEHGSDEQENSPRLYVPKKFGQFDPEIN